MWGEDLSYGLPENSGADIGDLTADKVDKIIADYKKGYGIQKRENLIIFTIFINHDR